MTINRYCGSHMRNPSGATLQIFYEPYCHPWTMRQNLTCLKSSVRFAKMFDPKQLPADFRQQLCNLPRPIAARAFKHHLCITGVEGELSEDLGEAPQTPPNTPSHVEPPEAVRRSGKKRPSEGKPEGSPSASPSWIQRHMRIPSFTSEISEASAVETRRSSTVMQEEEIAEIPGYLVEMQEEEIPGYLVEIHLPNLVEFKKCLF